jgi:hypothetical protein
MEAFPHQTIALDEYAADSWVWRSEADGLLGLPQGELHPLPILLINLAKRVVPHLGLLRSGSSGISLILRRGPYSETLS